MKAQELKQGDYVELDMNGAKLYGKVYQTGDKKITLEMPMVYHDISHEMLNRGKIRTLTKKKIFSGYMKQTVHPYRRNIK